MRKEFEIVNKLGLHARPAAQFVRCVIRFKSTITICKGEENFSAASIIEVLTANLNCGDRVVLEAVGPDEQEALNELEALLLRLRDEEGGAQGRLTGGAQGSWRVVLTLRKSCQVLELLCGLRTAAGGLAEAFQGRRLIRGTVN
jgi:phosphocarrier protein HPr